MKKTRIIISIIMLLGLTGAWWGFLSGEKEEHEVVNSYLTTAKESVEAGLYQQAIECYKEANENQKKLDLYKKIKEVYEIYYKEENTTEVRSKYTADMKEAAAAFPGEVNFWQTALNLQMEGEDYAEAYRTVKEALNRGASSKELTEIHRKLSYMVKIEYDIYTDFYTALNGYISVNDGNMWRVMDDTGNEIRKEYQYVGPLNDEGAGIFVTDIDTRLLDGKEIARARYKDEVEKAGYYSEDSKYIPLKINGVWKYIDLKGEKLPGEYQEAGSFYKQKAAVKEGDSWYFIDEDGKKAGDEKYKDIKLDLRGSYLQGDIVILKDQAEYHLYNSKLEKLEGFECEDIDICIENNLIAFMQKGLWGFADTTGKIIVEPKYQKAKSFSNGLAAVCNEKGLWGFINEQYELVIDYQFKEVHYFNQNKTCLVSKEEGMYQLMRFQFG